jgi:hypothetical protein
MKGLLIVLTVVAMVAAVFLGGYAISGILSNAATGVLAFKGILIWRLVGKPASADAGRAGES